MTSSPEAIDGHITVLKSRLGDKALPFCEALADNNSDIQTALGVIKEKVTEEEYIEINFVYHVAVIFNDDERFFDILHAKQVTSIQQLAEIDLQEIITEEFLPGSAVRDVFCEAVWARLFELQPREMIITALKASRLQPNFDQQPIIEALQSLENWDMFSAPVRETSEMGLLESSFSQNQERSEMSFPTVIGWLERLQRTLALTRRHTVEAASAVIDLMNSEFETASSIAGTPVETFISKFSGSHHPESTWLAIHSRACGIQTCNLCVVDALYNTARGSGMAALDGPHTPAERLEMVSNAGGSALKHVNLTTLFNDLNSDSCDHCNSVTSPAAYFIELLQFLRNNNIQAGHPALKEPMGSTVLRLFTRRADLQYLQLTCSNTTVLMPYLDRANELMERFVAHQTTDILYNSNASSSEALAEPEYIEIGAYQKLSLSLYPFTKLPYNQALDEVRTFLKHLKTSRHELLTALSPPREHIFTGEYLNLTEEQYFTITEEPASQREYEHWGHKSLIDFEHMQSGNQPGFYGGLLAKCGLSLLELVELLQTTYINPNIADPRAILILQDDSKGTFILTHLDRTIMTIDDWTRIRRFTQLWRSTGWRMREVDQAISGLGGPKGRLGFGVDIMTQIVAVKMLVELMGLEPEMLLPFWTSIVPTSDKNLLYTRLFLSPHVTSIDRIFVADSKGRFLFPTSSMKISLHQTVVEAAIGLTTEGLDAIKAMIVPTKDSDQLSIKNISTLYRHAVLAKFLGTTPMVLLQAIDLFKVDPFIRPKDCLEFVKRWQEIIDVGFEFAQVRYALTGEDDALQPLGPSKVTLQRALQGIRDSIFTHTNAGDVPTMVQDLVGDGGSMGKVSWFKKRATGSLDSASKTANVLAPNLTLDLMYSTYSEASGLPIEILRVLLPDIALREPHEEIIVTLARAAVFINGLKLSAAEVQYVGSVLPEYPGHEVSFSSWADLLAYVKLRDSLPKVADAHYYPLLEMFGGSASTDTTTTLTLKIVELFRIKRNVIDELPGILHVVPNTNEGKTAFSRANNFVSYLTKLKKAIDLADRVGTDINRLAQWANQTSHFLTVRQIASDIRGMMRGRSSAEDWQKTIKPLRDQLRHNQRHALIAALLVMPKLIEWGVVDEDSLFEYFLIDVKMGACLETSRIQEAISSVQLFIHRCFYGLEERYGVKPTDLDRARWEWMSQYRIWEANRMVFLYPENWVDPSLRDDKSPFFLEFESELMQSDLNMDNIEEAVQNYVSRMDKVANLQEMVTVYPSSMMAYHFAQTQATPFAYYFQTLDKRREEWTPWRVMTVDVHGTGNANELSFIPVFLSGRLLIFTPLIVKKMVPKGVASLDKPLQTEERVEIRIGWSEYRNKKWTSKQLSSATWLSPPAKTARMNMNSATVGDGDITFTASITPPGELYSRSYAIFRFTNWVMRPLFSPSAATREGSSADTVGSMLGSDVILAVPSVSGALAPAASTDLNTTITTLQYNSLPAQLLEQTNTATTSTKSPASLRGLYKTLTLIDGKVPIGDHELRHRHELYTWELGLHIPMLLMDRLANAHQYDKAREIAHFVFDPLSASQSDVTTAWKWPPFRKQATIEDGIQNILGRLVAGVPAPNIKAWRDNPFQPHVVARDRPVAYKKWIVVRYIEILVASGDRHFRQNTMESVPLAIQYYTLASHLYGPPGMTIPGCRQKKHVHSFDSLNKQWDAFSNAAVSIETAFPFHPPINCFCSPSSQNFTHGWNRYFCVPGNKKLQDLRATIDDRLYKIRHCQDINGAKLVRALFEPPIDPGQLVRDIAQGLSIANVLDHAGGPMPNYRFRYLLQKAFEMVQELKSLGSEFLTAKEKKDSHAYELIRNNHERSINTLVMDMKKLSLAEANKTLDALKKSRSGPFSRLNHYAQLIGEDMKQFANMQSFSDPMSAFKPIEAGIEPPISEDKLKLSMEEKGEIDNAGKATTLRIASKHTDAVATGLLIIPQVTAAFEPMGIGISTEMGTKMIAEGLRASALEVSAAADSLEGSSINSGRKATLIRQFQDRVQQANSAGYELEAIDTQIAAHLVRISIAQKDIQLQDKQIENAQAMENFLRTMYTSTELYSWQEKQLRSLYYQAYTVAYDLAQKVEKTFHYERGQTGTDVYIKDCWDANKDGLFSGEALGLGLRQLEAVYHQTRGHDFEITKHVSLRQLDPMEILNLQETSTCQFKLPEVLFDLDFPGHYNRRLKSVSLSLPCVVGPYASTNCTLQLETHLYRLPTSPDLIPGATPPITRIAVSNGMHDAGVFELNFNDERYLPFEGAGAISEWSLSLPEFPAFDYRTISDAILHLKYTSMPGNPTRAKQDVTKYLKGTQTALFDLPNEISGAWHQRGNGQPMALRTLAARLPWRNQGKTITVTGIQLLTSGYNGITPGVFQMTENAGRKVIFSVSGYVGKLQIFTGKAQSSGAGGGFGTIAGFEGLRLSLQPGNSELKDLWMLVKYTCV